MAAADSASFRGAFRDDVDDPVWSYERIEDERGTARCRFVLAHRQDDARPPLAIIGLNPSTARPGGSDKLDPTMRNVARFIGESGQYGGFVMLNLCPICTPHPEELPSEETPLARGLLGWNLATIDRVLGERGVRDVCAAWGEKAGTLPAARDMFRQQTACVDEIVQARGCCWMCAGRTTKGYPAHPYTWYLRVQPEIEPCRIDAGSMKALPAPSPDPGSSL